LNTWKKHGLKEKSKTSSSRLTICWNRSGKTLRCLRNPGKRRTYERV